MLCSQRNDGDLVEGDRLPNAVPNGEVALKNPKRGPDRMSALRRMDLLGLAQVFSRSLTVETEGFASRQSGSNRNRPTHGYPWT